MEALVNIDIPRSPCRTNKCGRAKSARLNLNDYDYWFVPVVNPDGYEHTHRYDRLWRKTRSRSSCGPRGGVDPNRNYPFHWAEAGASTDSCSEIYAGPKPKSEPEVEAIVNIMDTCKDRILMYVSLHSYSQAILSPYGYARVYPYNYEELSLVACAWIESVSELRGTQYQFGTSAILLYPAAGGSDDYAHGVAGIRFAYTIELPDQGRRGFILPPSEIIPVGQETLMGLSSMIRTMENVMKQ